MDTKQLRKQTEEDKALEEKIKRLWPDYSVPKGLLKNPTVEFTNAFFAKCLNELESTCFLIFKGLHEERLGDMMSYCPTNIDRELFLYIHIKYIMDLSNVTYIALTDLYQPPKRTRLSITIFLQLLLYIKLHYQDGLAMAQTVNNSHNKYSESIERQKQMQNELSKIHQGISETLENIDALQIRQQNIHQLRKEFEKLGSKELAEVEERERECMLLQLQLEELEEQIKSVDESNLERQRNIVTDEEFNTMSETLERLREEANVLTEKDEEAHAVFEEKRHNIYHLKQVQTMFDCIDLTTWGAIQELHNAKVIIDEADFKHLENKQSLKNLEEGIKIKEKELENLNKQANYEKLLIKEKQRDIEKNCVGIEKSYKTEINNHQLLRDQERLIEESIKNQKIKCQETEKEIQRIMDVNSKGYKTMLASYQRITTTFDEKLKMIQKIVKKT